MAFWYMFNNTHVCCWLYFFSNSHTWIHSHVTVKHTHMNQKCMPKLRCWFGSALFRLDRSDLRPSSFVSWAHYRIKQTFEGNEHKTLIILIKLFILEVFCLLTFYSIPLFLCLFHIFTFTLRPLSKHFVFVVRSIIVWFYFTIFACLFPLIFFWAFLFHQPCQCCLQCVFNKGMPCVQCAWF